MIHLCHQPFTYPINHSLVHSFNHLFNHLIVCSLTNSILHSIYHSTVFSYPSPYSTTLSPNSLYSPLLFLFSLKPTTSIYFTPYLIINYFTFYSLTPTSINPHPKRLLSYILSPILFPVFFSFLLSTSLFTQSLCPCIPSPYSLTYLIIQFF
jgi:hypothetical protein